MGAVTLTREAPHSAPPQPHLADSNRSNIQLERREGTDLFPSHLSSQTQFHQNAKGNRPRREVPAAWSVCSGAESGNINPDYAVLEVATPAFFFFFNF